MLLHWLLSLGRGEHFSQAGLPIFNFGYLTGHTGDPLCLGFAMLKRSLLDFHWFLHCFAILTLLALLVLLLLVWGGGWCAITTAIAIAYCYCYCLLLLLLLTFWHGSTQVFGSNEIHSLLTFGHSSTQIFWIQWGTKSPHFWACQGHPSGWEMLRVCVAAGWPSLWAGLGWVGGFKVHRTWSFLLFAKPYLLAHSYAIITLLV